MTPQPHHASGPSRRRARAALAAALVAAALGVAPAVARAQRPGVEPSPPTDETTPELLEPGDRRAPPDFGGRPEAGPSVGEALLWIPRALLLPIHLVTEYLFRRPIVALVTFLEAEDIQNRVISFFTFGPDDNGFLAPTFRLESGLSPSAGLFFRYRNAGIPGNGVQLFTIFGGTDLFEVTVRDQYTRPVAPDSTDRPWTLSLRGSYLRRPDGSFNGIGSTAGQSTQRYSFDRVTGQVRFGLPFDRVSLPGDFIDPTPAEGLAIPQVRNVHRGTAFAFTGIQSMTFGDDIRDGTSIPEAIENGLIDEAPPGFDDGYTAAFVGLSMRWDTRRPRPLPGSGWEVLARARLWVDVIDPAAQTWADVAAAIIGHLDLTGTRRVVSLGIASEITDDIAGDVPFTETVSLGGNGPLSGFIDGRVRGRSGVVARAEYSWPVAFLADGVLHLAAGNGFDEGFGGFGFDRLRLSFGMGIATVDEVGDHGFQLSIAAGTDEIGDGPNVESIRLVFGGSRDF